MERPMSKKLVKQIGSVLFLIFTLLVFSNYIFGAYRWISRLVSGQCTPFILFDICRSGGEQ